jgi:hypothetical protein
MRTHRPISLILVTLQGALCFCAAPILLAQSVTNVDTSARRAESPGSVTISLRKGSTIDFALLEPLSSATAVKGQPVRMAVVEDVEAGGVIAVPRGTPAEGVVSEVHRAKAGKRDGEVTFRPVRLLLSDGTRVKIGKYSRRQTDWKAAGSYALLVPIEATLVFFYWPALVEAAWNDHKTRNTGQKPNIRPAGVEMQFPACTFTLGYTAKDLAIARTDHGKAKEVESAASLEAICPANPPSIQNVAEEIPSPEADTPPEMR